ncbi:MAG: type II toxin-antitoxin system Phd/YefM family antitoxin [Elusimicrobia bacterium]|nr:type II toxin-antitoxin system Phd/YefM family antitoxin [Elusimicrobiota bacterium]
MTTNKVTGGNMKIATVRDFKAHAARYLHSREDVYVTRHGKPIAVVSPVPEKAFNRL